MAALQRNGYIDITNLEADCRSASEKLVHGIGLLVFLIPGVLAVIVLFTKARALFCGKVILSIPSVHV